MLVTRTVTECQSQAGGVGGLQPQTLPEVLWGSWGPRGQGSWWVMGPAALTLPAGPLPSRSG